MKLLHVLVGVSLATLSSASFAQIVNGGFELPVRSNGSFGGGMPGWSNSNGDFGPWNIFPGYSFFNAEALEGTQIGFTNGTAIAQQTGYTIKLGENKVHFLAARRSDSIGASFQAQLWAGGTVANGNPSGGTLLATTNFNIISIPPQ